MDFQRREIIALIGITKIGRLPDKNCPACNPHPELAFLMRIKRQVSGFFRIALKEPRQSLSGVHDAKISGVMDQFLVFVRRRRCRCDKFISHLFAKFQEFLKCFRSETAKNRGFIQRYRQKLFRINLPVTDSFIVRYAVLSGFGNFFIRADIFHFHIEQISAVADELLLHSERHDDQRPAFRMALDNLLHNGKLDQCLSEPERRKDCTTAAAECPLDDVRLMRFQTLRQIISINLKPLDRRKRHFIFDKFMVTVYFIHFHISL